MRQLLPSLPLRRTALGLLVCAALAAPAAAVPPGYLDLSVVSGLADPTAMAFAPDGRLFVCQQGGDLRVITADGRLLPDPFVSITVNRPPDSERGLLGVAIDPEFETTSPYVYVYYTTSSGGVHNRISRFPADGDVEGGNVASGPEEILVDLNTLSGATNHNGGAIHFGPDGKLYAAVGDNANGNNSQTLANRLGKILRYNKDGSIPTDNPFYLTASGLNRSIWALGLRNPFTFAFDATGGRMFVNDVGQVTWEEINEGAPGRNYGWPMIEGIANPPVAGFVNPLVAYPHGGGNSSGCAIVGGAFHDPSRGTWTAEPGGPDYDGDYFFADLCNGWIRRFDALAQPPTNVLFTTGIPTPVDLAIGFEGGLYYLARGGGIVRRIVPELIFADGFEG
jgi:glucose/arabinose dehydrogenase